MVQAQGARPREEDHVVVLVTPEGADEGAVLGANGEDQIQDGVPSSADGLTVRREALPVVLQEVTSREEGKGRVHGREVGVDEDLGQLPRRQLELIHRPRGEQVQVIRLIGEVAELGLGRFRDGGRLPRPFDRSDVGFAGNGAPRRGRGAGRRVGGAGMGPVHAMGDVLHPTHLRILAEEAGREGLVVGREVGVDPIH